MITAHKLSALACLALLFAVPATAWDVDGTAGAEDFQAFHDRFSSAAYFYPRHGAAPMGLLGFEVWVDTSADPDFGDEPFTATTIDGDLPGDVMALARVGVRKGLPGRIDLGAAYGRAVGGDVELISGEVSWAAIEESFPAVLRGFWLRGPELNVEVTGELAVNYDRAAEDLVEDLADDAAALAGIARIILRLGLRIIGLGRRIILRGRGGRKQRQRINRRAATNDFCRDASTGRRTDDGAPSRGVSLLL